MPGNHKPAEQEFISTMNRMRRMQRAAGQSQQFVISDTQSRPVINMGLLPNGASPAQYGIELLDPSSQDGLAQFGQLPNGSYGIAIFDATTGDIVSVMGPLPGGGYGFGVEDLSGNLRVAIGKLADGDYGLQVTDPTLSVTTEILPVYDAQYVPAQTTSSTTYVALSGPSVQATIASSGKAQIFVSAYIGYPGGTGGQQSGGFVGVGIDGALPTGVLDEFVYAANTVVGSTAVGGATSAGMQVVLSGLSAGQHTFKCYYKMDGPGTVTFSRMFLQITPL